MVPGERDGDQHQQHGEYPVEGSGSPSGTNPGADEAAGEQVGYHEPGAVHGVKGDGHQTGRPAGHDQDQAQRLIHDHGFQRCEAKQTNEQRKPELSAAETDQATEEPDPGACGEGGPKRPGPRWRGDVAGGRTYHSDTLVGAAPALHDFPLSVPATGLIS
ncbi:MAG TPA: hypothetical protein VNB87_18810 [Propionibacteriaceae bacterium]|nr:hypothetical protein [Propionibacteriaceae bacterium]